ncbi:MAG TPA: hypothetical protein VFU13_09055, partial [Steroidobacteraceae bacterium]|nr:hypothetical protein [Steroidobacteraceae bacterium]
MANNNPLQALKSAPLDGAAIQAIQAATAAQATTLPPADAIAGSSRLSRLLSQLEKLLSERYAFDVFAKDSINFGIMVTYQQAWEPEHYQVGDLVSTIPLAPKEIRRYTTRSVTKKTRAVKELEDNVQTRKTESSDTTRADGEIVKKAQEKTHFNIGAEETFGGDGFSIKATQSGGGDSSKESAQIKKEMRESVLRSAQEYRQQHRMEVDTSESTETEATTFHEIQNPNDELAVTYLFYELQRTYFISERIHRLTPVILVANEVPAPHQIDDAWLVEHDWILRRAILDDSFRPALDYLTRSFVGAEVNIRILESNALAQKNLVDNINQQIQTQIGVLASNESSLRRQIQGLADYQEREGVFNTFKRIFDPIGITGGVDSGATDAGQSRVDYARQTLDRAEREKARLLAQLEVANTALQGAVDKLSSAVKEHYDRVTEIDRLRVHVKENILYYMQAIWRQEPPDQRFFRLYNIDVPIVSPVAQDIPVNVGTGDNGRATRPGLAALMENDGSLTSVIPMPDVTVTKKKLVDVADLDNVLAYKGNYMVFALKEHNFLTTHMMQSYIDVDDELLLRDPDATDDYSVAGLQEMAKKLYKKNPRKYADRKEDIKKLLINAISSPRKDRDRVIVPTKSLYIECLVGAHPLLEDFKLSHRALDVKKVQAEVRRAELENIRLAARALEGEREDPD